MSTKVYVVVNNDRHYDTEVEVFAHADQAVTAARAFGARSEPYEEKTVPGWLFYACYSPEGDSVWVVEKTLKETP